MCVIGVQCVGVGVLVLVLVCHADPLPPHTPLSACMFKNVPHVYIQNVSVCTCTTLASVTTCGRAGTHGDVLNLHTGVFQGVTAHSHTHNDIHTRHNNNHHHNNTRRQGQTGVRERQRESKKTEKEDRERETEKERQDKTRQDGN